MLGWRGGSYFSRKSTVRVLVIYKWFNLYNGSEPPLVMKTGMLATFLRCWWPILYIEKSQVTIDLIIFYSVAHQLCDVDHAKKKRWLVPPILQCLPSFEWKHRRSAVHKYTVWFQQRSLSIYHMVQASWKYPYCWVNISRYKTRSNCRFENLLPTRPDFRLNKWIW